jgi:UDP-N-acetylglucosamine 2-epimerase (non-hydrolysing)
LICYSPYVQRKERIFVIGNPIGEVLEKHAESIEGSPVLTQLTLQPGGYYLVTLHRAENVDEPSRLESLFLGLARVAETYRKPLVVSLHPRTADKLARSGLNPQSDRICLLQPLGFFDFVKLERHAYCVLSDSGTVQEECCLFGVPNVTLRDVTERAETIECGSNILTGADPERIVGAVKIALSTPCRWNPPGEYLEKDASRTVVKILLGYDLHADED